MLFKPWLEYWTGLDHLLKAKTGPVFEWLKQGGCQPFKSTSENASTI
jgi:hypothetical protein